MRPCAALRLLLCLALTVALWVAVSSSMAAPALTVAPTGLNFVAVEGGANPPTQSFTVVTSGANAVSWFASSSVSWLQVVPLTGTTPTSAFVSANVAGMATGTYSGTILVTSRQTGASQVVSVVLTVAPQSTPSQ